jgi:hypothetical protein
LPEVSESGPVGGCRETVRSISRPGGALCPPRPWPRTSSRPVETIASTTARGTAAYTIGVLTWTSGSRSADGWRRRRRISAVSRRGNIIDAFGVAGDGRVYTNWYVDGVSDWAGVNDAWRNIGGVFPAGAGVSAVARKPGQLDLFVVGSDGHVHTSWWTEGVTDWSGVVGRWQGL